jgi:hypothetical protein
MCKYQREFSVENAVKYEVSLGTAISTNTETLRHTAGRTDAATPMNSQIVS